MIKVKQTVNYSDEQVNTRKEVQTAQTENINNADNNTVQQNNEEWKKGNTLILGNSTISGLIEKKLSRNSKMKVRYFKMKVRYFPRAKIRYHHTILLLEKKPENIILHIGISDAPYKSDIDILKDLIELKNLILGKFPNCKKIKLLSPTVHADRENAKKNNENLTNRVKEQGIPHITHDKHSYRDSLHLNSVDVLILAENFLSYIRRN